MPFDLPDTWAWCRIASIVNYRIGKPPGLLTICIENLAVKWLRKVVGKWAGRIPLSPGFRRAGGAPTSLSARRGGPCKALLSRSYAARRPLFRFCPTPSESELSFVAGHKRNQHRFCDANSLIINALRRGRLRNNFTITSYNSNCYIG